MSGKVSVSNIHTAELQSPRSQSSVTATRSPVINGRLERRPSESYNPHRQNPKAGVQSRNGAFTSSPTTSPMSPESTGSPVVSLPGVVDQTTGGLRGFSQRQPNRSPPGALHASSSHPLAATAGPYQKDSIEGVHARKRLDHGQSSRHRQDSGHHRAHSQNKEELKAVGEFAMHQLFHEFVLQSEAKISRCLKERTDCSAAIELTCGPGADRGFDSLITSLVYITRRKPRPLIDSAMMWRRQKAHGEIDLDAAIPESLRQGQLKRPIDSNQTQTIDHTRLEDFVSTQFMSEYNSAIVIYLTCRVLLEVFLKAEPSAVPHITYDKLEGVMFERLQAIDPNLFREQPFNRAIWTMYTQVLGTMSSVSLATVTAQFIRILSTLQKELYATGRSVPPELELKTEFMIRSTKHIHIKIQPEGAWRESCNFLFHMADLLLKSHGPALKHAYCSVLTDLVLPVASNWAPHLNTQKFRDFLTIVNPRITSMAAKPRHWSDATTLSSVLLCASTTDQFASTWLSSINSLQTKLKEPRTKALALKAITRLIWTYLERIKEPGNTIRRLEDIMGKLLPPTKKATFALDKAVCEPLEELIRIIGHHYPEYCFSRVIFPLINSDLFASGRDIKVEQLEPERMVIGIRAFLLIMADLESPDEGKPPFPRFGQGGLAVGLSTLIATSGDDRPWYATVVTDVYKEISSRPVAKHKLNPYAVEYHSRFCEILGKIAITCDNAFGGQAVIDEKFSSGFTPKTPLADTFTFSRRTDDQQGPTEQRLGIYELLQVAVQALPRCLPTKIQLKPLINLLCTCTAHVQDEIAISSIKSLKAIARQSHAQAVTIGFARFIFSFDLRYSTMSEEGLLGPDHIENTLRLYVELLQIWIEEIKQKTKEAMNGVAKESLSGSRGLQLDLTSVTNHVDEVESHGTFFLCSQSRRVRAFAVKVLKIVTEFDAALGRENARIIQILEGDSQRVMDMNDDSLTVAERSRLQKGKSNATVHPTLVELSSSDQSYDITLWLKVFPNIIRLSFELCPAAVMLGREMVCARLLQMTDTITFLDTDIRGLPSVPYNDNISSRTPHRFHSTSPQVIIEQWKLYLIMACTTVTNAGAQTQSQLDKIQHMRKTSKPAPQGQEKLSSARALFAEVIPLLSTGQSSIREAIVIALSSINVNLFRTLLDSLQYAVTSCKENAKKRTASHQRNGSNPWKDPKIDRMRTEVTQIYRLTARFLQDQSVLQDEWILDNIASYAKNLMIFLGDAEVQSDWDCQKLRRQYCGLLEELFNGVNRTRDVLRFMPFESRRSAFALMEDWCGYSPNQAKIAQREDIMRQMVMGRLHDARDRTNIMASIETEKRDLSTAALSAMAALCVSDVVLSLSPIVSADITSGWSSQCENRQGRNAFFRHKPNTDLGGSNL